MSALKNDYQMYYIMIILHGHIELVKILPNWPNPNPKLIPYIKGKDYFYIKTLIRKGGRFRFPIIVI